MAKAAKVDEKALAGKLAALLASRMAAREKDAAREARKTVRKVLDLSKQGASELEIAEEIQARAARGAWVDKVAAGDFVQAVESILGHHLARGGRAVLVNTDLLNSKLTRTFEDLAQRRDLPLLDLRTLFDRLGQFEERRKSFALSLANNADYETDGFNHFYAEANSTYLFRVFVPESLSVDSAVFITGNHPLLGDGRPNQIRMYDDGSHGDERALDRIWSLRLHFDQPPTLFFTFTTGGRSEKFAMRELPQLDEACFVQMGDFVKAAFNAAIKNRMAHIHVGAMAGKLENLRGPIRTAFRVADLAFAPHNREMFENRLHNSNPAVVRNAQAMLKKYGEGHPIRSLAYPVQAVRFGSRLGLVALGGEPVVDYALRARRELPNVIVAGYNHVR